MASGATFPFFRSVGLDRVVGWLEVEEVAGDVFSDGGFSGKSGVMSASSDFHDGGSTDATSTIAGDVIISDGYSSTGIAFSDTGHISSGAAVNDHGSAHSSVNLVHPIHFAVEHHGLDSGHWGGHVNSHILLQEKKTN